MIGNREGDKAERICDSCGDTATVNYWNLKKKTSHRCYRCSNAGRNSGRVPHNKGARQEPKNVGNICAHSDGYPMVWVGKTNVGHGYMPVHRLIMADHEGRILDETEKVHHINGVRTDFRLSNLFLCRDMAHHRRVHAQLEQVSMGLVRAGLIKFDQASGEYHLSRPMKEFMEQKSGELLETLTEQDEGNQQPSSAELVEKVQRLFRKEVGQ